jgi:hypothetical protein
MAIDRQGLIDEARQDPQFAPAIAEMEKQISRMPVAPEDLDDGIAVLESMVENPEAYEQIKADVIASGDLPEGILPDQFDAIVIVALLVALYGLQEKLGSEGYARGGLKVAARRLQKAGRGGDSMLAHINPREAMALRQMGGSGRANPSTGLPEYKTNWGQILGLIAPVAISSFFPSFANTIGNSIPGVTAGGALSSVIGNTVIGAATSALTGGKVLKGAFSGANLGGLSDYLGKDFLGINNPLAASLTGGALSGGVAGLINGNALSGAVKGAAGAGISNLAGQSKNAAIQQAGKGFGSMFGAGYDPRSSMYGGLAGGLTAALAGKFGNPISQLGTKPSDVVTSAGIGGSSATTDAAGNLVNSNALGADVGNLFPGATAMDAAGTAGTTAAAGAATAPNILDAASKGGGLTLDKMIQYGMLGMAAIPLLDYLKNDKGGKDNPQTTQEVYDKTLTDQQKKQMEMPLQDWDWDKINRDAQASGMDANTYMAMNWNKFSTGYYNKPQPVAKARGGALSQIAYLAKGSGTGRDDTINARLSDGEYVIDAETVALLGDGSTEAGAKRLDQMRSEIRRQKGKNLAKGKISPNAKSPLAYLKGAA